MVAGPIPNRCKLHVPWPAYLSQEWCEGPPLILKAARANEAIELPAIPVLFATRCRRNGLPDKCPYAVSVLQLAWLTGGP